ncbi:hypothetical protein BJV82DRAFT_209695 [Fennellomyces sp. T-0311]|nr:hypothetical protein BJV82DRAFT_209695 [Fennellomyces sp. T-0311]
MAEDNRSINPMATDMIDAYNIENSQHHEQENSLACNYEGSTDEAVIVEENSEKPPPTPPRRFYQQKKYWIICTMVSVIIIVTVALLVMFVFFPMVAQYIMNGTGLKVDEADISFSTPKDNLVGRQEHDKNNTFYMKMSTQLEHTGPFPADIAFHNPMNVYYNDTFIGTIILPETHVSGGSGYLEVITPFTIHDTTYFAEFAKDMLARQIFIWRIRGKVDVTAFGITATVDLNKEIYLQGMNGFPDVKITSFQLPGNAPEGGILVELGTVLNSPSAIGVQLGTIALDIGYEGVRLGQVKSEDVTLKKGDNELMLKGVLVPQSNEQDLEKIGVLFSNYVGGKTSKTSASGISCAPDGTNSISWLSEGFKSVHLGVSLGLDKPLDIIKGVRLGYLDLNFNDIRPYAPVASAPVVVADFAIPFGFSLSITEVSQELQLGTNDNGNFASISVPYVPAQSDQAAGKLQFAMSNVAIQALADKEPLFNDFTYALTASDLYSFQVGGNASTKTTTPIGNITLSGITFEVPTSLHGLQLLNSAPTVVNSVDVIGGTNENLLLAINVTMENPSDFSIATGDVNFAFLASDEQLGNVQLAGLKLQRGSNSITASSTFNPKVSSVGQNLLSTFVMGQDNDIMISGFDRSTSIASLVNALGSITITTTLPGLKEKLIRGAKLTVNEDSPQTGIVSVRVSIADPFSAALSITNVISSATYHGMPVGNINQDISGFNVGGHSTAISPVLSMQMNIQPAAIALLLRTLAIDAHMDTRALDTLLSMGGFGGERSTDPNLFTGFNITNYVMQAMQTLAVDLQLSAGLRIGDYVDDLEFSQKGVIVQTDSTVTRLIPVVGQPIVQQIVDGAELGFETIILSSPYDASFKVQMKGSITNAGPMTAQINFPELLNVYWEGRELGKVAMPTITTQANVGAQFDVLGDFTISDAGAMGDFAGYMINNEKFVWNIRTGGVTVTAIGYTFTGISMDKFVTLDGCNAFRDAVLINSFDLPSNHPDGGITLNADTSINNPSQIGFSLSGASFTAYYRDVELGPLASVGAANFAPKALSNIKMAGRLVPQETQGGLAAVTEVFKNYLAAKDSLLTVKGVSGSGPGGQVGWLTSGFKTISIDNVLLPGPKTPPELITSVTLKDLQMDFTKNAYAPPTGSKQIVAQLHNPFGFPLGVNKLNMDVVAGYQGHSFANLKIPDSSSTTSGTGLVTTQFDNVPFAVYNEAHGLFEEFAKLLILQQNVMLDLAGSTNVVANTAVGDIKLDDITFDVGTGLAGLNDLDGKVNILDLAITGGTKDYIIASVTVAVNNPSQISIMIGEMIFDVLMNEFNAKFADALLKNVAIVPGVNRLNVEVHVYSNDQRVLGQLISNYMTAAVVPLTIKGTEKSSQVPSLNPGLSVINLQTTLNGINDKLIVDVVVYAGIGIAEILADAVVTLHNPLRTSFTVLAINAAIKSSDKFNREFEVGTVDYALPNPMTVSAGQQAATDRLPANIILNENNIAQVVGLLFDPNPKIDITLNATILVGDGFSATLYYYQNQVPTSFKVDLGLILSRGIGADILKQSKIVSALPTNILHDLGLLPTMSTGLSSSVSNLPTHLTSTASDIVGGASNAVAGASDIISSGASDIVSDTSNIVSDTSNIVSDTSNIVSDTSSIVSGASDVVSDASDVTSDVVSGTSNIVTDALAPVLGSKDTPSPSPAPMPAPEIIDNLSGPSPAVKEAEPPHTEPLSPDKPSNSDGGILGWLLPF